MKIRLKQLSFIMLLHLIVVLITATVVEKIWGTKLAMDHFYGSPAVIVMWFLMAGAALGYLIQRRMLRRPATFLLHLSFLIILIGAFITHVWGLQGSIHLREGEAVSTFHVEDGHAQTLPFAIVLDRFELHCYPGTQSPMDYVSELSFKGAEVASQPLSATVSMNHIARHRYYRFYQSGYDEDLRGVTLDVAHDPWGIGVTYTGYTLLLIAMLWFLAGRHETFRTLLHHPALHRNRMIGMIALGLCAAAPMAASAHSTRPPKVLPAQEAAAFGDLYVLYNGRICPLQTVAKEVTRKLYGSSSYGGFTAEQVFTGWMFYPSTWAEQPIVKVKDGALRDLLGLSDGYAAWSDFFGHDGSYKLESLLQQSHTGTLSASRRRAVEDLNEKQNIIAMLYAGSLLKIYPCRIDSLHATSLRWFSQGDNLPTSLPDEQWFFVKKSMDYIHELVAKRDYPAMHHAIDKLREYQQKEASDVLPSAGRFGAEKLYNALDYTRLLAICFATLGIVAFVLYLRSQIKLRRVARPVVVSLNILLWIGLIYLGGVIALRGYISNHLPLANGYETMQFLALCSLVLTLLLQRRFALVVPFGFLLSGMTLLVSMMGESNPQITPLMPVLASPLLSIHVAVIMLAYALLAFTMLNGLTACVLHLCAGGQSSRIGEQIEQLQLISRLLLYPALFLLTAGIFIGAVWANVSWGRYWGWDPKEVWALITLLIYSLALHADSLPMFHRARFFHLFMILAFLSVLITYFGVNFLLGGMHSYANG